MNLVVDIGNTRVKWSVVDDGPWRAGRAEFRQQHMVSLLDAFWGELPAPEKVVVSNVAGEVVEDEVRQWLLDKWNLTPLMFRASARYNTIVNKYTHPEQLGCDRWAAVIGGRSLADGNLCVIDCGTAVTIDVLRADDEYIGGAILPGLGLSRNSLLAGTSDIAEIDLEFSGHLGRTTGEAVAAGTFYSIVGGIDRILNEVKDSCGEPRIFVTGGDALNLLPSFHHAMEHQPDLVLMGLAQILR